MKNVLAFITKYKALKAELDNKKAELESMKSELIDYVLASSERDEKGKAKYTCGQYTVTITLCKREDIDKNGLKEAYPDIAEEFKTITEYDRVTVK